MTPPSSVQPHGERLHWASPLVRVWLFVVAVAWILLQELLSGGERLRDLSSLPALLSGQWWVLVMLGLLVLTLAPGYWSWWTTSFVLADDELRIENRGAFTSSKRIAFTRIQSVDLTQPFAARVLGLAQLKIDVGGHEAPTLSFLSRRRAVEVRDHLLARAHGVHTPSPATTSVWDDRGVHDRTLIRLQPQEILLGAFLSHELWLIAVASSIPMVVAVALGAELIGFSAGLLPLLLGVGGFLSKRVVSQFNYTLAATPGGLRVTRGLTTLKSETVPVHRIQAIQISQPILWRAVRRFRIDVTVPRGYHPEGDGDVSSATLFLPVGSDAQVALALASLWPGLHLDALRFTGSPERARWLDPPAHSWQGFAVDQQVVVARQGWLVRRTLIVPHARLQSVSLDQGPWERRLGLADIGLHTTNPLTTHRIPHADAAVARRLVFDELDRTHVASMTVLTQALPAPDAPAPLPLHPDPIADAPALRSDADHEGPDAPALPLDAPAPPPPAPAEDSAADLTARPRATETPE